MKDEDEVLTGWVLAVSLFSILVIMLAEALSHG